MRLRSATAAAATTLFATLRPTMAIQLDVNSATSLKSAASNAAHAMMTWYTGNQTGGIPGILPPPYYWWECGHMFGTLIDYWYYTGDSTYNKIVEEGMLFQASPTLDYMPVNQTKNEGNDDQVYWGFAAMTAAEYKFPNPPKDQPQWLELAQGVWNSQQLRWDTTYCHGGLRWQIFTWNAGYNYKNSAANGGFINLGARLYAYTGNQTYADWVVKTWDWMESINLIGSHDGSSGYNVFDGAPTSAHCTVNDYVQWSYTAGMMLNAAAVMYNVTGEQMWADRANGLWERDQQIFFYHNIMYEYACEPTGLCDTDQLSFKASFIRFAAASTKWMPSLYTTMAPLFQTTATAAARQCTGTIAGLDGNACGFNWTAPTWDGSYGFGQQMDAMQAIGANLVTQSYEPVTARTGGISKGNPSAGTAGDGATVTDAAHLTPITKASTAGASILTAFVVIAWLGACWWMVK